MPDLQNPALFPVTTFEKIDENGVFTKARVRIFYKYGNRNGSYITDEFADKLLATLPGSPIKGIYSEVLEDYQDHGKKRTDGRAYGFVPETNHNIAFEDHEDEDGIVRTYACTDAILWTALYEEANDIIGAPQSMELHEPSIEGEWKEMGGKKLFVFKEGSFLGLQALGQDTEPCFQGAAFFSLLNEDRNLAQKLYGALMQFQANSQQIQGGNENMPDLTFKLSDRQKENKLFQALNKESYRYYVHETYDNFAIVFDWEDDSFKKIAYTKDDGNDTVEVIGDMLPVFSEYVTKEEQASLNTLRSIKGTFTESLEEINAQAEKIKELEPKIEEYTETISTLSTEKETLETSLNAVNEKVETLQAELNSLSDYKKDVEKTEKEKVIAEYEKTLDAATIEKYKNELDDLTVVELEKELAFALVKSNPTFFSAGKLNYLPKDEPASGLAAILDKYKK